MNDSEILKIIQRQLSMGNEQRVAGAERELSVSELLMRRIEETRAKNAPRVDIRMADIDGFPALRNFFVDDKLIGRMGLSDGMYVSYLYSPPFLSTLCILLENGFSWEEIKKFTKITLTDKFHLQLRQIELIHQLTTDKESAFIYYSSIYFAAKELAKNMLKNGFEVTSIFLAGGSAMLLDPDNFPLQVNPKARIENRISVPRHEITIEQLADTLVDIDIIAFGRMNSDVAQLQHILGETYGGLFTPLGQEPQKVIDNFPSIMGLDVIVCQEDQLDDIALDALGEPEKKIPIILCRYPTVLRNAESRIAPGLITEMIPIWWNPNTPDKKKRFHTMLGRMGRYAVQETLLYGCAKASRARKILYADPAVKRALESRWRLMQSGVYMDDLFDKAFGDAL